MHSIQDIENATRNDVAKLFSVHPATVGRWSSRDKCPRNKNGKYNISKVIKWRLEEVELIPQVGEDQESKKNLGLYRRERWKLARIDRQIAEGELITKNLVGAEWGKRLHTLFSGIRLWSARLSPRFEGKNRDEISRIFEEETYLLQLQFSKKGRYTPDIDGFATFDEPDIGEKLKGRNEK